MHHHPLSILTFALSITLAGAAEPGWKQHLVFEGPGNIQTALAADFTGDGLPDVIASSLGKVRLFTAPDWQETVIYTFPSNRMQCIHSCVIDIDRDGDPDYVGAHSRGPVFWLETPDEPLVKGWNYRLVDTEVNGIHCLLARDVNLDGRLDVIVNSFNPDGPLPSSITWQEIPAKPLRPDAKWKRHVFARGDAPGGNHYMGLGDIDGDGLPDITCGAKGDPFLNGNWFAWWRNPGLDPAVIDTPWKKQVVAKKQIGATNLIPAELNGDKRTDLLASRGHGSGVLWFEQSADHSWIAHDIDSAMEGPHCLVTADLDGDGDLDAATCGKDSMRTAWYENDGHGAFTIHNIGSGHAAYDIRAIDMDRDTDLDLLIGGQFSGNVVWYENPLAQQ